MYYLVKGQNGVVIKEGYGKALGAQKYLIKSMMKKYEVFEEAEATALEYLSGIVPYYIPLPANIRLDEFVTRNKLFRAYKESCG